MKIRFRKPPRVLRVHSVERKCTGRCICVTASVNQKTIWFESCDAELVAAPEAYGSFLLIPAQLFGSRLVIDDPVCETWRRNVDKITPLISQWWDCDPPEFEVNECQVDNTPANGVALCFSGGVDSFYSLLRGPKAVDKLLCGIGYDVGIFDARRHACVDRSVRKVAAEFGVHPVFIATNLRSHPDFRMLNWEKTHGGALAAFAHLMAVDTGVLEISSSCSKDNDLPWGSRWDLDGNFSSSRVKIDHVGAEVWRSDKLRAIAQEPIVRRHLRVCWQCLNSQFNCCKCEKCVRTMCVLETCGQLENYEVFERGKGLSETIDELPPLKDPYFRVYENMLSQGLAKKTRDAVQRWLNRSRKAHAA